jgi:2-polyprenyl-3-methyl-5-hydroxy-6-metoxy-1,4-benzoquinol methylase
VRSFEELDRKLTEAAALPTEDERLPFLCNHHLAIDHFSFPPDPFGADYRRRVIELWSRLSGRPAYSPDDHEKSGYGLQMDVKSPPPFNIQSPRVLGDMLIAWGFIIRTLDLKPGQSLLEYGPGSGQILLNAARMGIRAAGIDIDEPQVRVIREQASRLGGLDVRAKVGYFGDTFEPGEKFDAVLFFESFHHALDHIALVDRLHEVVADDGVFVLAGEPIMDQANPFRVAVPFPWGPRLDLLSLRAMRVHGWMELGFQEEYFLRLLARGGWLARKVPCPLTPTGILYVARKNHGRVGEFLLPADEEATWYPADSVHRWTRGHGLMTLDSRPKWSRVSVSVTNHNPSTVRVTLACGPHRATADIGPGQSAQVVVSLPAGTRRLEILSPVFNPKTLGISDDNRDLGVYVGELTYS